MSSKPTRVPTRSISFANDILSVVRNVIATQSIPPQVLLVYDGQMKAYGRARLKALGLQEILWIFEHDFQQWGDKDGRDALLESRFSVTFYRTHGQGDREGPITIDEKSWEELIDNVARIELAKAPKRSYTHYIIGAAAVMLLSYAFLAVNAYQS